MTIAETSAPLHALRNEIHIAPLPQPFLDRVRNGHDDQGAAVVHLTAEGGEPCRDVLRRARSGEALILASFTPFTRSGPYKEYGPVFVLANESRESVPRDVLPLGGYLRDRFVIRAYSEAETIIDAAMCRPDDAAMTIERFFESPKVAFLHARFPTYGCFALRIDRA